MSLLEISNSLKFMTSGITLNRLNAGTSALPSIQPSTQLGGLNVTSVGEPKVEMTKSSNFTIIQQYLELLQAILLKIP